jgi:hypothetical protein
MLRKFCLSNKYQKKGYFKVNNLILKYLDFFFHNTGTFIIVNIQLLSLIFFNNKQA